MCIASFMDNDDNDDDDDDDDSDDDDDDDDDYNSDDSSTYSVRSTEYNKLFMKNNSSAVLA